KSKIPALAKEPRRSIEQHERLERLDQLGPPPPKPCPRFASSHPSRSSPSLSRHDYQNKIRRLLPAAPSGAATSPRFRCRTNRGSLRPAPRDCPRPCGPTDATPAR